MIRYADLQSAAVPKWEERPVNRGRMRAELDHLSHFSRDSLLIDDAALLRGVLRVEFQWPIADGRAVDLEAIYPDSFPRLRPHVILRCKPEDYPDRHCAPDGSLCLLGRDSGLWRSRMTLADILYSNLAKALDGSDDEDPQGEPVEFWWNEAADRSSGSFVLVDSSWNLAGIDEGRLEIQFVADWQMNPPTIRAAVTKVWDDKGNIVAQRNSPLPDQILRGRTTTVIPWRRDDTLPMPKQDDLPVLIDRLAHAKRYESVSGGNIRISATVTRSELQFQKYGDAWVFVLGYSKNTVQFSRNGMRRIKESAVILPTYRDGVSDIGGRVPSVSTLRDKTIAVIGLGALGSPIAADLARNGCRKLIVLDSDIVEPGNSIRWIAGASAWGLPKADFLKSRIETEYPWTQVEALTHRIGTASGDPSVIGDDEKLVAALGEADLVIDAAASTGITFLLGDYCRASGIPLVSVYGATTLRGGVVAYHHPTSGCPICKETAHDLGTLPRAPGMGDTSGLLQPPGCSEATFTGASFDLQELSMEAVRMVVDVLSCPDDFRESVIHTLALHDGNRRVPPNWRVDKLPVVRECGCT
ncbi:MAG: hypothetical protein E5X75_02335 [Mesorhizobium sp.]|nr:MAG: hypothetical protein E5X75_02335 [Mesorhizobium sp.]